MATNPPRDGQDAQDPTDAGTSSSGRVIVRHIEDELRDAYLTYAVSVNTNRAIPDVRDGLKPSSRRILYAMYVEGMTHNRPYDKSAAVVGEVMKNYHPHGDDPIYETLVGMVQDFTMRYPLLDGQGNFGSIDDDPPGAMRYTEVRMAKIADEMLADIDRDTVDFQPNYKDSTVEPTVLPARLPNLIVNGTTGIGVGYMTRIPPHNLSEVVDALVYFLEHPNASLDELMQFLPGPDFPTGGIIVGTDGIRKAYATGQGTLVVRGRTHIERTATGTAIVITEIPYHVKKNRLLERIAEVVNNGIVEGISDVRDESDREIRVVIELKRDAIPEVVLNNLLKHTPLQTTFGVQCLCLVDGLPRQLSLPEMLGAYLEHRKTVVQRRTAYELKRAEQRLHILEGYRIALANLDEIIAIVQNAASGPEARETLIERFELTEAQANEILGLTLRQLTGLERQRIHEEYTDLLVKVEEYRAILESELLVRDIIKQELLALKEEYGDERRTQIIEDDAELSIEDLIADELMVITLSHAGYIKRIPLKTYRRQRRGGVGVRGAGVREDDFVESLFVASAHEYLLCFTNQGKCYWLKVYDIPEASRQSRGRALANLLRLQEGEWISAVVPLRGFEDADEQCLFFATRYGVVKRTLLKEFSRPQSAGIIAQTLRSSDDQLIEVRLLEPGQEIILVTRMGMAIRFGQEDVRVMGRQARGVQGIKLRPGDEVVSVAVVDPTASENGAALLVVTEHGYGKRTPVEEYRAQSRGGVGVITVKTSARNGEVVDAQLVYPDDEILVLSSGGHVTRMRVEDIRAIGRNTQGVRIMSLQEGERVQAVARVPEDVSSRADENPSEEEDTEDTAAESANGTKNE